MTTAVIHSPFGPVTGGTYDGCEGTSTYTFTYTDCEGNTHDWVYTYTIERLPFTDPTDVDLPWLVLPG